VRPAARLTGEVGNNDRELTTRLSVVDLGSGASPASGGGGTVVARPRALELR
jgi:hypothetical protein